FHLELAEMTEYFPGTPFRAFQAPYVGAVAMAGGASHPRRQRDAGQQWAEQRGPKGLAYLLAPEGRALPGPVPRDIPQPDQPGLLEAAGAAPADCIFFAAGEPNASRALLGAARGAIAERLGLIDHEASAFAWVVDAPMFEPAAAARAAGAVAAGGGASTAV